jgi:TrmH family RNA methyltransferase
MRTMGIPPALDGVVLVLDRPRDVTNVGGVVRAMGNFGLARLRLVEPAAYESERVVAMAHRCAPVLARLEHHATLDAALADCGFVLGTTARPRAVRHERMTPRQAAPALLSAASRDHTTPAAVLFGPEDRGLSNAALGRCNAVVTIPTAPDDPSLNLAQSALVIAYELWLAATTGVSLAHMPDAAAALITAPTAEPLAQGTAREEMFAALEDVLWGMHPNNDAGRVTHTLARLRAVLLRAAPRVEEVQMLTRLFVHIAHERRRQDETGMRGSG